MKTTIEEIIFLSEKLTLLREELNGINNDLITRALAHADNREKLGCMKNNLFNLADFIERVYGKKNLVPVVPNIGKDVN